MRHCGIICLLFFSLSSNAQSDLGKQFIEALNSTSVDSRRILIQEIFSSEALINPGTDKLLELLDRLHEHYAPSDYHHSETMKGFNYPVMHIYAREQGATMYTDFQFFLDAHDKLSKLAFIAEVAEPVNLPNGTIDQPYTLQWLNDYVDKLTKENDLFGSFYVAKGNRVLFERQVGFEDVGRTKPITRKTLFGTASGGKMFTAVAIAKLVEGRKLSWDDPVTRYLNGFTNKALANKITIRHLLTHTSGVNEYWAGNPVPSFYEATTIQEHLKLVYQAGISDEAGQRYQYCNSNYILLGAVIEKVTGQSFYDFVQQNIFNRAGMTTAGYYERGVKNVATGLARAEVATWKEGKSSRKGSSAGGAVCSLDDIIAFSKALRNNTLIRQQTLQEMTSIQNANLERTEDYGFGFILSKKGGEPSYGHGGTADGVNFEYDYFQHQDVTLILFNNQNNGAYDDLKRNIIKLITGDR